MIGLNCLKFSKIHQWIRQSHHIQTAWTWREQKDTIAKPKKTNYTPNNNEATWVIERNKPHTEKEKIYNLNQIDIKYKGN